MVDAELGDKNEPGSPASYVKRLDKQLIDRSKEVELFEEYYQGKHRLAFATDQFRKAFGTLFKAFSDNWMALVVDAVEERLNVEGFRIPTDAPDPGESGDEELLEELTTGDEAVWDIWQANNLDAESQIAHTGALTDGIGYVLVGPGDDYPEITVESALQMIVGTESGNRRERVAAWKKWQDDWGYTFADLYLPGEVYKLQSPKKTSEIPGGQTEIRWQVREVPGENWPLPNPLGVVPVVPLRNRPLVLVEGVSEIKDIIPIQDGLNKLLMDMLVASEYAGFRQRTIAGIEIPTDPETGQPRNDLWKMAFDRFLTSEDPNTKFGTLEATDLDNYVKAIELAVHHIASRTRTPPHYFYMAGFMPSGESLRAAETGLVAKVRRKQVHFGEAWEEVIRLALIVGGDSAKADAAASAETIWSDPEFRTESEHTDAVLKMQALGIPNEFLWGLLGFSPQQIERIKDIIAAQPAPPAPASPVALTLQQDAPQVNVSPPNVNAPVTVNVPKASAVNRRIIRDTNNNITGVIDEPAANGQGAMQ